MNANVIKFGTVAIAVATAAGATYYYKNRPSKTVAATKEIAAATVSELRKEA